jgi:RHS repeat-associated protein
LGAAADYTLISIMGGHNTQIASPSFTMTPSGPITQGNGYTLVSALTGGSGASYATATLTIAGTEQYIYAPVSGTATLTFAGTEQSVLGPPTATITIAGTEKWTTASTPGTQFTQYVYSPGGRKLAVVQNGVLVKGTIPLPGGESAIYNASGLNFIRHKDWLGSSRLATTWAHGVYSKEAYAPFGETYNEAVIPDRSFTGQDQDTVPGVYDYLFRKYDPAAGRWLSPDPAGWDAVNQEYPQSLDRYAYVQNDPLTLIDSTGLSSCLFSGEQDNTSDCLPNIVDKYVPDASYAGPAPSPQLPTPVISSNWKPNPWTTPMAPVGCDGPKGLDNIATNCGYKPGAQLNILPDWYKQMALSYSWIWGPFLVTQDRTDYYKTLGLYDDITSFSIKPSFDSLNAPPDWAIWVQGDWALGVKGRCPVAVKALSAFLRAYYNNGSVPESEDEEYAFLLNNAATCARH